MEREARERDMQHKAGESAIGDEHIAAAAEDKKRQSPCAGPLGCLDDIGFALRSGKPPGGPADAEGGQWRDWLIFCQQHWLQGYITDDRPALSG